MNIERGHNISREMFKYIQISRVDLDWEISISQKALSDAQSCDLSLDPSGSYPGPGAQLLSLFLNFPPGLSHCSLLRHQRFRSLRVRSEDKLGVRPGSGLRSDSDYFWRKHL